MKTSLLSTVVLTSSLLAACGGGGGSGSGGSISTTIGGTTVTDFQGFWTQQISDNSGTYAIILSDGTYYSLYLDISNPAAPNLNIMQGTVSASAGSLTSTNLKDFDFVRHSVTNNTLSASYVAKSTLNGAVTPATGSAVTFARTYDADYETKPTLATLAGTYSGYSGLQSTGLLPTDITVTSTGVISSNSNGCIMSGTATPRSDGNVYDVKVSFGSACYLANQTVTGIAYYDSAEQTLYAMTPNADRTNLLAFIGEKTTTTQTNNVN